MPTQQELEALVRDVLGESALSLRIWNYHLSEDVESEKAQIVASLQKSDQIEIVRVEGVGVGMIDALFTGIRSVMAEEFPSLEHIRFIDFGISGDFNSRDGKDAGSDAIGRVSLGVENSHGRRFVFQSATRSVTGSSVATVVAAVEHFVNAERAVLRVLDWIADARRRARPELVERYTHKLAELIKNASYSEVIGKRKAELDIR